MLANLNYINFLLVSAQFSGVRNTEEAQTKHALN